MSRLSETVAKVPCCTLAVVVLCGVVHASNFLLEPPMTNFTLSAKNVIYLGEYYRILTAAFMHASLMHIVFNMMSTLAIGSGLESTLGTIGMIFTVVWSTMLCGVVYVAAEWAMTVLVTGDPKYINQHAVGFSGVIFTLALLESYRSTEPYRSVFGFFNVPTRLYPWVLLGILSIMMPGVSFAGHLAGILVGLLHAYNITKPIMPSPAFCKDMEDWRSLRWLTLRNNFKACPPALLAPAERTSSGGLLAAVRGGWMQALTGVWWVLSTLLHIVGLYNPGGRGPSDQELPRTQHSQRPGNVDMQQRLGRV